MHITVYNLYSAGELCILQSIIHIMSMGYAYYNL